MQTILAFFQYCKNNKKQFFIIFIIIGYTFLFSDSAFGSTPQAEQTNEGLTIINFFLKMIAVLLAMMTALVGLFLYPEWTSGSIIGLDKPLHDIWILVSNVVYLVFAFLFVWLAFMNIIGKDGDTYQLKQAIPRFIIGIIIVPFSWFLVQFLISMSNILTVAVLSLPLDNFEQYMQNEEGKAFQIPYCESGYMIDTTQGATADPNQVVKCFDGNEPVNTELTTILNGGKDTFGKGIYNIMFVYTYGVMRFDDTQKLFKDDVSTITSLIDLIFKSGFSLIFIVVYALLVIALGLALFVRGMYLWIFAMFSPVFGLLYYFKKTDGAGEGITKRFKIGELFALAMVPVYVSAALVFGLLFISVAGKGLNKPDEYEGQTRAKVEQVGENQSCLEFMGTKICWNGVHQGENSLRETFGGFKGSFGSLLAQIFGIIFLWMAVMAALKQSEITKEAVDPIMKFGESIGDLMKKAPSYAPIIPTPGGPISATGLQNAGSTFQSTIANASVSRGTELGRNAADKFVKTDKVLDKLDDLARASYAGTDNIKQGLSDGLKTISEERFKEQKVRDKLATAYEKMGATTDLITKIKMATSTQQLAQILYNAGNSAVNNSWKTQEAKIAARSLFYVSNPQNIEGMIGTGASSSSQSGAGTPPPTGVISNITPDITNNQITIKPLDNNGQVLQNGTVNTITLIDVLPSSGRTGKTITTRDLSKFSSYSNKHVTRGEFEDMLNNAGITDDDERDDIIKQLINNHSFQFK